MNANEIFEKFLRADSCKSILEYFDSLVEELDMKNVKKRSLYLDHFCTKITSWRSRSIWEKLNRKKNLEAYRNNEGCKSMKVLVIGAGPCGLRTAIEAALLGCRVVVMEKRDYFSRHNTLHIWPFVIEDLKSLATKDFFSKFCIGGIGHISIRRLQSILLKVALLLGVEVYVNVAFDRLLDPPKDNLDVGWRCQCTPDEHPVSNYQFSVIIGADGKGSTLPGFVRKEIRGPLAIAVTINFKRKYTGQEAKVQELGGLAVWGKPEHFHNLVNKKDILLENCVYFKGETHYFVMTAMKESLLKHTVLRSNKSSAKELLHPDNIDKDKLTEFACSVAEVCTDGLLPDLECETNHRGEPDVAIFDFTAMYYSESSSRVLERNGHKLLMGLVGDSLLEPFWPLGTGCGRGFLSSYDAAWMIRQWASGEMTILEVLAERESIYTMLSSCHSAFICTDYVNMTVDPKTRYKSFRGTVADRVKTPDMVRCLYTSE